MKAVELDDTLAEAHTSLAITKELWDWLGEERRLQRAIELNPNYATAHHWYSVHLAARGRHEQALVEAKKALELDPVSLTINLIVGARFYYMRRYDQAIEQYLRTIELDPSYFNTYRWLGWVYAQKGMYEEAIAAHQKAATHSGNHPSRVAELGHTYAVAGRRSEALKILGELLELSKQKYVQPERIAVIYIGLGEKDQAFEWLEKAFEEGGLGRLPFLKVAPEYDPLRDDPRFQDLLRRMNFPEN